MLERIATIITAIWFLSTGVLGLLTSLIDIISYLISGEYLLGCIDFFLISLLLTPPISLILIYSGAGLDKLFNLQDKKL
jgi:hypothetical protein